MSAYVTKDLNPSTTVYLHYGYTLGSGDSSSTIAGDYRVTDNVTLRAKLLSSGALYGVYTQQLSPTASLALSAQVDAQSKTVDPNALGIKLALGDA